MGAVAMDRAMTSLDAGISTLALEERVRRERASLEKDETVSAVLFEPKTGFKRVLFNSAHEHTTIRTSDRKPYLRFLGAFQESKDDDANSLASKAREIFTFDPQEMRIAPIGQFFLVGRDGYKDNPRTRFKDIETRERERQKVMRLLHTHARKRNTERAETTQNVLAKRMGEVTQSLEAIIEEGRERPTHDDDEDRMHAPVRLEDESSARHTKVADAEQEDASSSFSLMDFIEGRTSKDEQESSALPMKPIPPSLAIHLQTHVALAVVDDYETDAEHRAFVEAWASERDTAYAEAKRTRLEALFRDEKNMEWDDVPTRDELLREYVAKNPPPSDNDPSECRAYERQIELAHEGALWALADRPIPTHADIISDWFDAHPPPDIGALPQEEPAVAVLHVADSEEKIQEWIDTVARDSGVLRDYDIGCVVMYTWIPLLGRKDDAIKRVYRDKRENDIMEARRKERLNARQLRMDALLLKNRYTVKEIYQDRVVEREERPEGLSKEEFEKVEAATRARKDAEERAAREDDSESAPRAASAAGAGAPPHSHPTWDDEFEDLRAFDPTKIE